MDAGEAFRAVRRRAGLSQRALAARSGVALSTIGAVEAGRTSPSVQLLTTVLEVAGLELSLDLPPPALDARETAHLRLSLSRRLHRALGGGGHLRNGLLPRGYLQLVEVARAGRVWLHGDLARALWLPSDEPLDTPELCVVLWRRCSVPDVTDLRVVEGCARHVGAPVVVPLTRGRVHADPPGELAHDPAMAAHRPALRAVARTLHREAPRDEAGRRVRAHRDPDHAAEREHVFHTKRFGRRPMPDGTDTRAWRLDDDAGRDAWLRRSGYPV